MNKNYNFVRSLLSQETNARRQESNSLTSKKQTLLSFFILLVAMFSFVQGNSQVTTNGGSGLLATYPSLADAVTALNYYSPCNYYTYGFRNGSGGWL